MGGDGKKKSGEPKKSAAPGLDVRERPHCVRCYLNPTNEPLLPTVTCDVPDRPAIVVRTQKVREWTHQE